MDRELNRSVRILEDALSGHGKNLLRTPGTTPKRSKLISRLDSNTPNFDLSLTIDADEMRKMMESRPNITMVDETLNNILQNHSLAGPIVTNNKPWEEAAESLYIEFLEIIQARTNIAEIFDTVMDLARCCTDTLNVIRGMKSIKPQKDEEKWLEHERNTWRLIYCLYQDRMNTTNGEETMPYLGVSEKLCVQNLYKRDSLIRETQLIIDWLECNAYDEETESTKMQHFTDKAFGWENTLHQLTSSENIVFRSSKPIISSLHPDAPYIQKLPIHDLDVEDDERLSKKVFREIRCGRLSEAQKLCLHCGQPWRASVLEGWRLFHNPNLSSEGANGEVEVTGTENHEFSVESILDRTLERIERDKKLMNKKSSTEGNMHRDSWKMFAWKYCEQIKINVYQRASVAAFSGHLNTLLSVANTWEDYLWAYMRTMVDIRVESEIRDYVAKVYKQLPVEYWDNRISLNEIFDKIDALSDPRVSNHSKTREHIIQKYIILDQIPQLMEKIEMWIDSGDYDTQFLRFISHLVLFFKQIGVSQNDDIGSKVLETYVQALMKIGDSQLVAYYVATLGEQKQVKLYASYLENIKDSSDREQCLKYGDNVGLDIKAIARQVVENIRNKIDDFGTFSSLQRTVTEDDMEKISALDWVLYYPTQRVDALYQSNALISYFLITGKIDAAKLAFGKIPLNSIDIVLSGLEEGVSKSVHLIIREHLSYKSYLDAHEAFNDWFKYFHHSKPAVPMSLPDSATFTEKVAYEHRVSQNRAETERWKLTVSHLAKTAKTMLYNVLLFPDGGWLSGLPNVEHLRKTCIPEVVVLLYSILFESEDFGECVQLVDILASEKYRLYKVYRKDELENLLKKFSESSIKLLERNKDMWGVDVVK